MKQIQGVANNITTDVLGRVTFKPRLFGGKDYILMDKDAHEGKSRYAAVITEQSNIGGDNPIVGAVNFEEFTEGDVVLINSHGLISFYYEKQALRGNALFVTERCNHRCIMCPQPPVTSEVDKTPINMKLIQLMGKEVQEIGITGGEPTLLGDKLFELIRQIQHYAPHAGINVLSNGVRFADKEYAKKMALCKHYDLQIDIPIFSDIASEHNYIVGAPTFYKTIQGLYNLALFHQKIGLRIVVHKKTYRRLPQLAEYIYRNFPFVQQVAFLQMETIGIPEERMPELWVEPHDYNKQLREAIRILDNRGIHVAIYNAQLCVLPEDLRPFAVKSISDWKDSYVEECDGCALRGECGGVFATNKGQLSKYIKRQKLKKKA